MEEQFVSEPKSFYYNDQNHVDFAKTFDLTGNENDHMLKFYLKKAGYSDNIECFTSEQRRKLIYDIVKSNKHPGYWKPTGVLENLTPTEKPISQKTAIDRYSTITLDSIDDIPPASMTFDLESYRQIKKSNTNQEQTFSSVQRKAGSALYERQFSQPQISAPKKVLNSANSFQTTKYKTRKGRIVEVSGPKDFRHVAGDMTRDKTKNAFDLAGNLTNNTLKKYMIERGITEEDVSWMDRKDLIKRIVQSNFTWMPPRNTANQVPPPPSEQAVKPPSPTPSVNHKHTKVESIKVAPPRLPESIHTRQRSTSIRKPHPISPPPPPPQMPVPVRSVKPIEKPLTANNNAPPPPPPPPPMPVLAQSVKPIEKPLTENNENNLPPSPPPMPVPAASNIAAPPPPPPPPMPLMENNSSTMKPSLVNKQSKPTKDVGDHQERDALLQSIRNGVTLKKVNKSKDMQSTSINPTDRPLSLAKPSPKLEKLDLISELRTATLKRIQKIENNPYISESEC